MSYIFKYHPDNTIYRNGAYVSSYADFMAARHDFPLVESEFFEYGEEKFVRINEQGHDIIAGGARYQLLIQAINNLGD